MFYIVKIPPSSATHSLFYSDVVKMLAWRQKPTVLGWVLTHFGITATKIFRRGRQALGCIVIQRLVRLNFWTLSTAALQISLIMCLYFGFFKNKSVMKYRTFPAGQLWKHLLCLINKRTNKMWNFCFCRLPSLLWKIHLILSKRHCFTQRYFWIDFD